MIFSSLALPLYNAQVAQRVLAQIRYRRAEISIDIVQKDTFPDWKGGKDRQNTT